MSREACACGATTLEDHRKAVEEGRYLNHAYTGSTTSWGS